ncbi:hypothetical protein N9I00_00690 [bacterium]|nr:hypothetical protein [bacterium]
MKEQSTLLYEWRQRRLELKNNFTEHNLQEVIDWWKRLDYHHNGFNYDNPSIWPDVWEYITEGFYTNSGNGLGCLYTVHHACPDKDPELLLIHDLLHGDMYLICVVDGWVLNRRSGILEKFEDVSKDFDILKRFSKEFILNTLKFRDI